MTELERQKRELIPIESQVNIGGNLKKWKTLTNKEKAYWSTQYQRWHAAMKKDETL